mmetsp:Transcript_10314/g.15598  ORF Transcript_10314/g.15598 Transcript_10314/m.15598 type:complete len:223 (+) Transcript_10314:217-885(+)
MRICANIVRPKLCAQAGSIATALKIDATALAKLADLSDEDQVRVLKSFQANFRHGNASAYLTTPIQAATKSISFNTFLFVSAEEWFLKVVFNTTSNKTQIIMNNVKKMSSLISKNEVYAIWEHAALQENSSSENFLSQVTTIIQDLHNRRHAQASEFHTTQIITQNTTPRFKLTASTLGMSFIFRCPRFLHRLRKNAKYVDPRAWETRRTVRYMLYLSRTFY